MAQLISQCLRVQTAHRETSQLTSSESVADQAPLQPFDSNKRLETFNYYHKLLHPRRLSSPIYDMLVGPIS